MSQLLQPSTLSIGLSRLNNSRLFTGVVMIIMNIGGKYIAKDIPKNADKIFSHWFMRVFVIFCISFVATHDIVTSGYITVIFFIIFKILINEKHSLCVIPKNKINIDINGDGHITLDEIIRAQKIIDNYKQTLQRSKTTQ